VFGRQRSATAVPTGPAVKKKLLVADAASSSTAATSATAAPSPTTLPAGELVAFRVLCAA